MAAIKVSNSPLDPILSPPIQCSCGDTHDEMPWTLIDVDENGTEYWAESVCRIHGKHEPCRRCLYGDEDFLAFRQKMIDDINEEESI